MANDAVGKLRKLQAEAQDALDDARLAQREEHQISRLQAFVHFWVLVGRSFARNRCPLRASGLAYASLLAMVPMLAVVISVSASLLKSQGEEPIHRFIDTLVQRLTPGTSGPLPFTSPAQPDGTEAPTAAEPGTGTGSGGRLLDPQEYEKSRADMVRQINAFVGNIRSGTLGATGMVALLFVAITMLSRIEDTFNDIWGVTRGRSWFTRIVQYWGAMTLGPIVLAVTFTLTSGPYFEATKRFLENFGVVGAWTMKAGLALLPYAIWSLAFSLFYQLMPNTKVRWRAALMGGVVGGCLWQLNSEFSVLYVSRVVSNSRIYGSLGMVPVFMIGLYIAWVILLFGAQVAYAFQNRRTYLQEKQAEGVHQRGREFVALRLATEIARRFQQAEKPAALTALAERVGVPTRLAGQVLHTLVQAHLLAETTDAETAFLPARPLDQITVQDVLQAIRAGSGLELATRDDPAREVVRGEFERIAAAERSVGSSLTLQALAGRMAQAGTP
jgi:membrane protein